METIPRGHLVSINVEDICKLKKNTKNIPFIDENGNQKLIIQSSTLQITVFWNDLLIFEDEYECLINSLWRNEIIRQNWCVSGLFDDYILPIPIEELIKK